MDLLPFPSVQLTRQVFDRLLVLGEVGEVSVFVRVFVVIVKHTGDYGAFASVFSGSVFSIAPAVRANRVAIVEASDGVAFAL